MMSSMLNPVLFGGADAAAGFCCCCCGGEIRGGEPIICGRGPGEGTDSFLTSEATAGGIIGSSGAFNN